MVEEKKVNTYLAAVGYASLALVILFIVFIHIPDAILYARSGVMKWVPFVLIFLAFPYSLNKTFQLFIPKYSFLISVGSLFIFGPLFGVQLTSLDQLALERDGLVTSGKISKKWEFKPTNRDPEILVIASFEVGGQGYETNAIKDEKNELRELQQIEIIYSQTNPNINTLHSKFIEEKE